MKIMQYTLFATLCVILLAACGSAEQAKDDKIEDTPVKSVAEMIEGKWTTTQVKRSGKKADLPEFYAEFKDNVFTSNIFDANSQTPYANGVKANIDNGEIYFDELDELFYIKDISDTSLVLETQISQYPFEFYFSKN